MNAHDDIPDSPDNPGDNRDAVVIPLPRRAPDDDIGNLLQTGSDQQVWWYDQERKRGGRSYTGHVNHVHGAEAERVRGELAEVIRELLDWAAQQQSGEEPGDQYRGQSTEDGEAA